MSPSHLEPRFAELRAAAASQSVPAIEAALEALDADLAKADPLTRAAGYAQVQLERGRPLDAARALDDVLAVIGDDARAHHRIGQYKEQGGDLEGAARSYERAVGTDESFAPAWVARGVLYDGAGDCTAAMQCYRKALLAEPRTVDAWRNLGNALAAQRDYAAAAGAYQTALELTALELKRADATLRVLYASTFAARGDLGAANEALPPSVQAELGRVHQETHGARACRFFAPDDEEAAYRRAAQTLLSTLDTELGKTSESTPGTNPESIPGKTSESTPDPKPDSRFGVFAVPHDGLVLVCDPDPVHPRSAHRFFDCSTAVRTLVDRSGA